ncbi:MULTISPECIES: PHP domain-containing protein [unclassified Clostridium]|uniref:PHP domain-containing protein n=1 Tax=Clostridium TaxID=1485 RepID=UPI001C8B85D0|nr:MULTISPECIES: PHP domain-containing protein [unclassified Clostridium]MBX9137259.1 PHP domain-containing protein [Clostridium sp. K12(2020)]MBX9144070.1 PHP domain-containing protein [Clostridium sp. K13]MDU4324158.1 PHP domain-containing protein [Clostridium celatum]
MLTDLHIHSYYSDGTMSPQEIVEEAKNRGLEIISITDHDVLDSYEELKVEAEKANIKVIRGVEIDSIFEGHLVHLLAYKFNDNEDFFALVNRAKEQLLETSIELIRRMEKEYENISLEDYNSYEYDRRKGGWKGIHYLFDKNITEGLFDGMKLYGKYECGHEKFDFPTVKEVCDITHNAGGYVVLAHPCNYYKDKTREEILEKLEILKSDGIDGVECYYPANSDLMTETCLEFCRKNDLIITAGSDSHGDFGAVSKGIEYYLGAVKADDTKLNLEKIL